MRMKFILAGLILAGSLSALSQVAPAATEGKYAQWSAGGGVASIYPDYGHGRIYGGALWVDYSLAKFLPPAFRGAGLELEGRDTSLDRPATTRITRLDTVALGGTYSLSEFHGVRLYAKLVSGLGNADYIVGVNKRYNQSRTVTSFGGGVEYRAYKSVFVRLDYEYQYFPDFFLDTPSHAPLDPQGFTLGALYHFSHKRRIDP